MAAAERGLWGLSLERAEKTYISPQAAQHRPGWSRKRRSPTLLWRGANSAGLHHPVPAPHRSTLEFVIKANLKRAGRPPGPRMPCGWCCGAQLACTEMRKHFTACPRRPKRRQWMKWAQCRCCAAGYESPVEAVSPLCTRCRSGRCRTCAWRLGVPSVDLGGRPSGPRMPCGWGCGAKLSATEMRGHFTRCPKRP